MKGPTTYTDALSKTVAHYLATLKYWGTAEEIRDRWREESGNISSVEYSYQLDEDFDHSLIYLPSAIHFLESAVNTEIVSAAVANFLRCWSERITNNGMPSAVVDRLGLLLEFWYSNYPANDDSHDSRSAPCRNDDFAPLISINLLNELLEKRVPVRFGFDQLLADTLFARVFKTHKSETISANLLSFLLKVKTTTDDWKIYRHASVVDAAFNSKECQIHAQEASDLLRRKCSTEYLELMRSQLLGDSFAWD